MQATPHYFEASPVLLAQEPVRLDEPRQARRPQEAGWPALYAHLEARLAAMKTWRLPWWRHFGEIARYELPRRYLPYVTANTNDRGLRRDLSIVDSTPTLDGETAAGGMMTVVCPPDRPWLKLGPAIPNFELDRAGQMFFDDLTERINYVNANSNFYDSQAQFFEDAVFFGNGVVIDYEDGDEIIASRNPAAGEYCLAAGADLNNQSLYLEERRTVSQIVEMFGLKACPQQIRDLWAQKGAALEQELVVGCAIEPNFAVEGRQGQAVGKVPGNFPWREVYWLTGLSDGAGPLSMAGFHEKPHAAVAWHRLSNDPYGRGPGSTGLGDSIQLQLENVQKAEALEKVVKPPMGADPALKNEPASQRPGAITYYDTSTGRKGFHPLYEVRPPLEAMTADIVDVRQRIGRAFHADLFRMIQDLVNVRRDVSATEIDALLAERLMRLGPVIGRIYKDGLRPRMHRRLAIMKRRGLWPRIPQSLANVPMEIEFISMLTIAQRASSTAAIERTYTFASSLEAGGFTGAKDVLRGDDGVRKYAELRGLDASLVNSPAEMRRLRDEQNRQRQMAALAADAGALVQGAKVLSETELGPNNALGAALGVA